MKHTHIQILVGLFSLTVACDKAPPEETPKNADRNVNGSANSETTNDQEVPLSDGEVFLGYPVGVGEGGTGDQSVVTACYFTGPHEHAVVAEFTEDLTITVPDRTCGSEEPYMDPFWSAEVVILRSDASLQSGDRVTVRLLGVGRTLVGDFGVAELSQDSRAVLSVRQTGSEWWAMGWVPVEASGDPEAVPESSAVVQLPGTWSDLKDTVSQTRSSYTQECTDSRDHGIDENALMTDAEFDDWIHTPDDPCQDGDGVVLDAGNGDGG